MKTAKTTRVELLAEYRKARQHQMATYGDCLLHVNGVNQRQHTGGGAAYGEHAVAAYTTALQMMHFRRRLSAYAKTGA